MQRAPSCAACWLRIRVAFRRAWWETAKLRTAPYYVQIRLGRFRVCYVPLDLGNSVLVVINCECRLQRRAAVAGS